MAIQNIVWHLRLRFLKQPYLDVWQDFETPLKFIPFSSQKICFLNVQDEIRDEVSI